MPTSTFIINKAVCVCVCVCPPPTHTHTALRGGGEGVSQTCIINKAMCVCVCGGGGGGGVKEYLKILFFKFKNKSIKKICGSNPMNS